MRLPWAVAAIAPLAWGQTTTSETTTTTTTTEGDGTITEYTPGNVIVLKESSGPHSYKFGKRVVYVTKSGRTLSEDELRTRVRVGIPVRVHYVKEGDDRLVDRVIVEGEERH